jgi:site-specific DNA-methyltransferase (adenine-specific)
LSANVVSIEPAEDRPNRVDPASLRPFYRNPRVGNVPLVVESLRANGQYRPLIVNTGRQTGRPDEVLAGNHLLAAGLKIGLSEMLVHWVDVDDEHAARIVVVDNRASDKGTYDQEVLGNLLLEFEGDLEGTGYNEADLQRLLGGIGLGEQGTLTDPDAVPAMPKAPRTKPGYVWKLGEHRLICGDSTDSAVINKLCGPDAGVSAMWTDPPYGVEYVGKTKDALRIQNDDKPGLAGLLFEAFTNALTVLSPGAPCYIAHADTERLTFEAALREAGFLMRQNLIWVKNAMVLGRSDYQYKHEPILEVQAPVDEEAIADEPLQHEPVMYGFTPGATGRLGRGGPRWFGDNKQTTVYEIAKPTASRDHPTMKPTELIAGMLRNSVQRGGTVLDLFAGSGSTLIACHQLNLVARLVELDPRFCDVICRRYEEATGVMPILESTGKGHTFVTAAK